MADVVRLERVARVEKRRRKASQSKLRAALRRGRQRGTLVHVLHDASRREVAPLSGPSPIRLQWRQLQEAPSGVHSNEATMIACLTEGLWTRVKFSSHACPPRQFSCPVLAARIAFLCEGPSGVKGSEKHDNVLVE
eukprot:Amastigsp_a842633_145.p4 type:complete len:136 gc:universal Amastigsp_a842633_145:4010-4417(+)